MTRNAMLSRRRIKRDVALLGVAVLACCTENPAFPAASAFNAVTSARSQRQANPFGVAHGGVAQSPEGLRRGMGQAVDAGAGWLRFTIQWRDVERSRGKFDWTGVDTIVAAANDLGLELVAIIGQTPLWNTSAPADVLNRPAGPCGGTRGPFYRYPPADYAAWEKFAGLAAARYKGRVAAWEIWNEPDRRGVNAPGVRCNSAWCGTRAEYAKLLALASLAVRREDPDALVLFGGLALAPPADTGFLVGVLGDPEYPGARYVDAANVHFYREPAVAGAVMDLVRSRLAAGGARSLPVWVTETGRASDRGDDEQVAYVAEAMPKLRAVGAEKVFWFRLFEPVPSEEGECATASPQLGLLTPDGIAKPSLRAFKSVAREAARADADSTGSLTKQ